jgi:hypothetical protein
MSAAGAPVMLRGQIELLVANLQRCRAVLGESEPGTLLPTTVRNALAVELGAHEDELGLLLARVGREGRPALLWESLEAHSREADLQMAEVLGLLAGVLVRYAGLDCHMCVIADALLNELSVATSLPWERLTILAQQESYTQREQIIHLRFPEFTVWALALAAHEFGHFVAQDLLELRPDGSYEQLVATELNDSELPIAHARELFSDIFATFVLGPAYPATAILLRFKPADTEADNHCTHPSDAQRAYAMIHALRTLSSHLERVSRPYDRVASLIEHAWSREVRSIGGQPTVGSEVGGHLDYLVDHVFLSLLGKKLDSARYAGWAAAHALEKGLASGRPPLVTDGVQIRDVLNAAWLGRLTRGAIRDAVDAIDASALELLRQIAKTPPPPVTGNRGSG